ncbi:hypothetical protein SAMN05421827_102235 [Pedobacter terrae]|uniref:Uncharacterized protein n=1 Tax=Pedobacter terrae TaxID=405671 RepID=A0A1G7QA67_9SPHI|nr:hypothetical protein SAMN05421827_102235 [Pedobacter terrae]
MKSNTNKQLNRFKLRQPWLTGLSVVLRLSAFHCSKASSQYHTDILTHDQRLEVTGINWISRPQTGSSILILPFKELGFSSNATRPVLHWCLKTHFYLLVYCSRNIQILTSRLIILISLVICHPE